MQRIRRLGSAALPTPRRNRTTPLRVRRLLAAAITVGLVAPTAAIVSTSGTSVSAAVATSIVPSTAGRPLIYSTSTPAEVGDYLYSNVDIVGADGSSPYGGTTTVQRLIAGQSTWTTVSTTNGAYVSSSGLKAVANAVYRITWSGSGDWSGSSADVAVRVSRAVEIQTISGRRAGLKGKVKPAAKIKIKIERKYGKKYKKMRTVKSNKKGKFIAYLPAPRRGKIFYRITFAGSAQYEKYVWLGYTY